MGVKEPTGLMQEAIMLIWPRKLWHPIFFLNSLTEDLKYWILFIRMFEDHREHSRLRSKATFIDNWIGCCEVYFIKLFI